MNTQQIKFLAIAAVVGLHAVVITFMLAQHGCKSDAPKTTAPSAMAPAPAPAAAPGPVAGDDKGFYAPTTPPPEPVRPAAPAPAPQPVAQYSESLNPPTVLGVSPAPTPAPAAPTVLYEVGPGENLSSIAHKNGVSLKELVDANAPKVTNSTVLQPKMQLKIPAHVASGAAPVAASGDEKLYKVVAGDSLAKIASANHTSVKALQEANGLTSTNIRQGQMLKLPSSASAAGVGSSSPAPAAAGADEGYYTVVPGDTLGKIANKVGVSLKELYASSGLNDTTAKSIKAGQKIKLPANAHAADSAALPSPSAGSPTTILTAVPATTTAPTVTAVPASSGTSSPPVTAIKQ